MFLPKSLVLLVSVSRSMSRLLQKMSRLSWTLSPLKRPAGQRTALAEELQVELSPTLVVTHRDVLCTIDQLVMNGVLLKKIPLNAM